MNLYNSVRSLYLTTLPLAILLLSGCSKNNDNNIPNEISVKKISGTFPKTIDLSGRKIEEWTLSYGNYKYSTQLIGSNIVGTAYEAGYNNIYPASILFVPNDWRDELGEIPLIKSLPPSKPNFRNQNIIDSLLWADILYANYEGEKVSEIEGLRFSHANALWDFELQGFPEGSSVKLTQLPNDEFLPFYNDRGRFQYIMMGSWWTPNSSKQYIIAYVENKIYKIELDMNKKNTVYEFTLKFDTLQKKISIEDLRESVWSDRNWPDH